MDKRNVFISAGHSNIPGKDMGAIGIAGVKEGDLTVELRDLIVNELILLNQSVRIDNNTNVTKNTVAIINKTLKPKDVAIDIHFNAFSIESVRGTEILVPFKSSEFERTLAKQLSDNISACLSTKNRGVKTEADSIRKHLMFMTPNCENILIETCFITNKADILMYINKKNILAQIMAKIIFDSLTK